MRNSGTHQSYEEYDFEKAEKKSKEFLERIMGKEKFDKLQKDGKIEIEYGTRENKTVYELYSNGRVVNKTKNQSYCIVADRSDYPINDMVAIKYAWLLYGNELAEKVANKTPLDIYGTGSITGTGGIAVGYGDFIHDMERRGWNRQQVNINGTPSYAEYVDYMLGREWHRELIILDQNNTNIVSICGIQKDYTSTVVDVRCPSGMQMSIMGTKQVPSGADSNIAYSLGLYTTNENGEEIPDDTKMRITKVKPSEEVIQLARLLYSDIKMTQNGEAAYRFRQGIELHGEEHFVVHVINSQNNIPAENVKFRMEVDLWARNT